MQCSSRLIPVKLFHLNSFVYHTLCSNGCIPVDKYRKYFFIVVVVVVVDLRTSDAFNNWVNCLKVRRVWCDIHLHLLAVRGSMECGMTEVVFYITIDSNIVKRLSFKLRENLLARLPKNIGQYVQATAVRHPKNKLFNAVTSTVIYGFV